jgi:Protein of unknown function (DUF1569)
MKTLSRKECEAELVSRLRQARVDSVGRWGRMSAHQMICHVCDSFRMALGEKHVKDVSTLAKRTLVKQLALYMPLQWRPGIVTVPEVDQEAGGTRPIEFAQDLKEVETLLVRMVSRAGKGDWPPHPIFGRMSEADWMRWAYLHTDHHLRQFGL